MSNSQVAFVLIVILGLALTGGIWFLVNLTADDSSGGRTAAFIIGAVVGGVVGIVICSVVLKIWDAVRDA
jgi:hypothetical protein